MIVKMAKVAVIGPKEELLPVLSLIHSLEILHVDRSATEYLADGALEARLKTLRLDKEIIARQIFFQELKRKIESLVSFLPELPSRDLSLSPQAILHSIEAVIDRHLARARELFQREEQLARELQGLQRAAAFLAALSPLLPEEMDSHGLEYLGIEIRSEEDVEGLEKFGIEATGGRFHLQTVRTPEGRLAGLLATEPEFVEVIRKELRAHNVEDCSLPQSLDGLSFPGKARQVKKLLAEKEGEHAAIAQELSMFAGRWLGMYRKLDCWLGEELAVMQSAALLFETQMCFVLSGWLPVRSLKALCEAVTRQFGGKVVVEERALSDADLATAPIMLQNSPYFQPFEMLSRVLPLPAYGAMDLTPFIGIFFPIFFGIMLGDIAYGLLLLLIALPLAQFAKNRTLQDAGKIFGVAAGYTIIFGWLFGEFLGSVGKEFFGLEPVLFDRHEDLLPMFLFAMAVGVVHILLGLFLGAVSSLRQGRRKKAWFKLASIVFILALVLAFGFFRMPEQAGMQKSMLVVLGLVAPVLLVTGGLLAPLEVLQHFGNIISYARIMAIGLTSVLLAHVANQMAGMLGSLWLGVVAAVFLHAFNILLGVFAPAIHSLRLHYVEFFSKVVEGGGKEFKPLGKE